MPANGNGTQEVYDRFSGIYDRVFGPVFQRARQRVVGSLVFGSGGKVLEVGVGTGLCLPIYPRNCQVIGIDLSPGMLREAASRIRADGQSNARLLAMDAGRMGFADSGFDLVIAAYVVTAVDDHRALMGEIIRVSRPGARIILLNHFVQDSPILAAVERAISPICRPIGFRTDLSVSDVVSGWPLVVTRNQRLPPLRMWRVVECVNRKTSDDAVVSGTGRIPLMQESGAGRG